MILVLYEFEWYFPFLFFFFYNKYNFKCINLISKL